MQKEKTRGIGALAVSLLICVAAFILVSLIFTVICYLGENPLGSVRLYSLGAFLLSGAAAAFINAKRYGEGSFALSLLTSLLFGFLFILTAIILSGGKISGMTLMNLLCYLLVSALFALLGTKRKGKPHRQRR